MTDQRSNVVITANSTRRKPLSALVIALTALAMVLGVSGTVLTIAPAGVAAAQGGDTGGNPPGDGETPGGGTPGGNGGTTGPGTNPGGGVGPGAPGGGTDPGGVGPGGPGGGTDPNPPCEGPCSPLEKVAKLNAATAAHAAATKAATAKLNAAVRSGDRTKIAAAQAEIQAANKKLQSSIQGILRPTSR